MKTAASIAVLAALGLVAVNYSSYEGSQLNLTDGISQMWEKSFWRDQLEEMAYIRYVTEHGKSYATKEEFHFRKEQFKKILAKIAEHESNAAHGSTVGLNEFADWTEEELKKLRGFSPPKEMAEESQKRMLSGYQVYTLDTTNIPLDMNWISRGAVTSVKNQGQCGSCWTFSSSGAVEGAMFLKTGKLETYSQQQLVDCDKTNGGCHGGLMSAAFEYVKSNPLMLEADYPYTGKVGQCQYLTAKGKGEVVSYINVAPDATGKQLKAALNYGPVSVGIDASQYVLQGYTGGVITQGCGTNLDHAVLAVGHGTDPKHGDYFIIKNSWGATWGDKGYVHIAPGQCGVTQMPSIPFE